MATVPRRASSEQHAMAKIEPERQICTKQEERGGLGGMGEGVRERERRGEGGRSCNSCTKQGLVLFGAVGQQVELLHGLAKAYLV